VNASTAGSGLRHAALVLHALAPADRAWMLNGLAPSQRAALEPLLQELCELGIPPEATAICCEGEEAAVHPDVPEERREMEDASPEAVARILRNEPSRLAAAFLVSRPPAWRARFLATLQPDQASLLQSAAMEDRQAPALQAAVLVAVQRRLANTAPQQGSAAVWQRFRQALRAWRRT
jgi:hypothetical protein